jgi:hypothetical protein
MILLNPHIVNRGDFIGRRHGLDGDKTPAERSEQVSASQYSSLLPAFAVYEEWMFDSRLDGAARYDNFDDRTDALEEFLDTPWLRRRSRIVLGR